MLLLRQVLSDSNRQVFRKDSHSRISGRALAKIPVPMVIRHFNGVLLEGLIVNLGLINANDVGLDLC